MEIGFVEFFNRDKYLTTEKFIIKSCSV